MNQPLYKITIPKPCLQDWNTMTKTGSGRFCNSCQKVVTDFTAMSNEEIEDFFIAHKGNAICGRFKNVQLEKIIIRIPAYALAKKTATWKKYLLLLLICFGKDLFPIDIVYGSSQNLYAQTPSVAKKKKHKKRKAKKSPDFTVLDGTVTLGFTVWQPDPPLVCLPPFQDTGTAVNSNGTAEIAGIDKIKRNTGGKNPPLQKNTREELAFILPTALSPGRKKRK